MCQRGSVTSYVSILVLMDLAHELGKQELELGQYIVSILVLMDLAHEYDEFFTCPACGEFQSLF